MYIFSEFVINALALLCVYLIYIAALVEIRFFGVFCIKRIITEEINGEIVPYAIIHGIPDSECG